MRKILLVVSFLVFLLMFFSSFVNAQTATSANTNTDSPARVKQQMQEQKVQKKSTVSQTKDIDQVKREKTKTMIKIKRDEFKAKLKTISNQRKKALVERIDVKLMNVNTKHTGRFIEVLNKLQAILDKVNTNTTDIKILVNIKTAQTAIDVAKTAVEAQTAKVYTIYIANENSLRSNVGATNSQLRQDLMATHKLVVNAKQTVQNLRKDKAMIER